MKKIYNNPYRIAGILSNASEREIHRQKGKLTKFVSIGKQPKSEYDFDFLFDIQRTSENLNNAFSKLEQNHDKVENALYWFIKLNPFDETAIEYLKNGDKVKATEILQKITSSRAINSKNFSNYNNLGTLKLFSEQYDQIKEGVEIKLQLIESDSFDNFVHTVADETYSINREKLTETFVDDILHEFKNILSTSDTIKLFNESNGRSKKYITQKVSEEPIHNIEVQIETTKKKRKADRSTANKQGYDLVNYTANDIAILKSTLHESDLKYKMIADSLAKEVMQCGIDYFQEWKETADPSEEGLKLLKIAKNIAVGTQTIERANENIEGMQEWAKTAPIQDDLIMVTSHLKSFQNKPDTISNAISLVNNCNDSLRNLRAVLGVTDDFYRQISSSVINNALGMIIEVVNNAQSRLQYDRSQLLVLPDIISKAVSAINMMDKYDMDNHTRHRYVENKRIIQDLNSQLSEVRRQIHYRNTTPSSSGGGGCYIATMAYGEYNHPQVIVLRAFRDQILNKSYWGRGFIKLYYKYSPQVVKLLKNQKFVNKQIRNILDQIVKLIQYK